MSRVLPKVKIECPEVEFQFHYEWESTGDDLEDHFDNEATVTEIRKRIEEDDLFAWFYVKVTATWGSIMGDPVYLGGCSYEDEADFLACEMSKELRHQAYNELLKKIAEYRHLTTMFILRKRNQ